MYLKRKTMDWTANNLYKYYSTVTYCNLLKHVPPFDIELFRSKLLNENIYIFTN